jgi:predicted transcriptional regulator
MMPHPYPNFAQALRELAATDAQRAALLGVSRRMVLSYKRGDSLPSVD